MRVCVVEASGQNVFFAELLDALAGGLAERGVVVERSVDCFPAPADDLVFLFVPHEYLPLVLEDSHPDRAHLSRAIALCTEQPGTPWFDTTAHVAQGCAAAVDINPLGVTALRDRGVDAVRLPLGYVPQWDHWGGDQGRERPIDLTFLGGHTDRRATALATCGATLQRRRSAIHLSETIVPHTSDDPQFVSGERRWELLVSSKVMLNVHRAELPYMEWLRAVQAMVNGCVYLTEHPVGADPLVAGVHFVSARFSDLSAVVDAVLRDPDGQARMRREAYELLRTELPLSRTIDELGGVIEDVGTRPGGTLRAGAPGAVPRPLRLALPEPPLTRPPTDDNAIVRMALKHLVLEVRALKAAIAAPQAEQDEDVYVANDAYESLAAPSVTVVLTVYNYADHVAEALLSLARAYHENFEVVVIEDRSIDRSLEVIEETLQRCPWLPTLLVRRGRNRGLAAGRNLGFELARAPYVFVLDADNTVYPQALTLLEQALDERPDAAFAYGLIEAFDERGPGGLVSWQGWNPDRLRYGNFVDAMAMTRRDRVRDVGGYVSDPALYGWEDFALWASLASAGHPGVRVPEIVARYRVAPHSMVSITNIDATSAWATLLRRYSALSLPVSDA